MIRFFMSSNLYLNSLRIQNSPQFHVKFDGCEGVLIENVYIDSPALSPNTDGIHVENTKSVGIYNSMISNGNTSPSFTCINVIIVITIYLTYSKKKKKSSRRNRVLPLLDQPHFPPASYMHTQCRDPPI